MITNLLVLNSSYVGSRDLWWAEDEDAKVGYNIYRAFDHPSNWARLNSSPWLGHFYRDMSSLEQVTYTAQPADFIERGELGRWAFRLPNTPYATVDAARVVVSNSPDDVSVTVSVSGYPAIDGQTIRPVRVDGFDRTVWMQMDNTLAQGGAVSDTALVNAGNVSVADYSEITLWQVTYKRLLNYVDIYASLNRTYYCYSDDTEVFTKDGWKLFTECQKGDLFATRRIQTKEFEWQQADGFFKARYDGDLVHFYGQSMDQLVTPNHRMLVDSLPAKLGGRGLPKKREHVIEAVDLAAAATENTGIATTSVWAGTQLGQMIFGGKRRRIFGTVPRKVVFSGDEFCAFMGMYLAEGSILYGNNGFMISQPCDARGSRELYASLLFRVFGEDSVTEDDRGLVVHSAAMGEYLRKFGHAHEKFVPDEIREAEPHQLEIFWKYYYAGDGAAHGDKRGTQQAFTVSKRLADHLTEVIQKMGGSSTACIKPASVGEIRGRKISCRQGYFVSRHARKSGYTACWKIENVEYHGDVFCVSVPNMFLYVRRNGKACWSGNTVVPVGEKGECHEPGAPGTVVRNTQEVDEIDWIYAEMVRRNQFLFEIGGGEPAYCMFRKWRGERCGCVYGTEQPKHGCPSCYETGFVGGYIGPYDFVFVPPDSAITREITEGGIKTTRDSRAYLTRTPIVQNGDLIVRRNGDRMVISNVVYKMPRGIILQQDFTVSLLPPGDTRYLIPVVNTGLPTLYNPVVRRDPLDGKGGGEPVFDPRTVPAVNGGKDWENKNVQIGRTVTFGQIQT
jgi:hypothetical protein